MLSSSLGMSIPFVNVGTSQWTLEHVFLLFNFQIISRFSKLTQSTSLSILILSAKVLNNF